MSGFFDTNILIYRVSAGDPRQRVAADLLGQGGSISVQVLNEFASAGSRKLRLSWTEISDALAAIRSLCRPALPLTVATHELALGLAARYGFPFYDASIAASALEGGCATLYSEDFQDGLVIEGRLTVRNPFRLA